MSVMDISELQNISSFSQWIELPNKITGGNIAWDTILISFEFVVFLSLLRAGQNLQKSLITSLFSASLVGLLLFTIGLIDMKIILINILGLAVTSVAFLKHND